MVKRWFARDPVSLLDTAQVQVVEYADYAALELRYAALEAERDALKQDAERYLWLRDKCDDGDVRAGLGWLGWGADNLDAAIDAARGA